MLSASAEPVSRPARYPHMVRLALFPPVIALIAACSPPTEAPDGVAQMPAEIASTEPEIPSPPAPPMGPFAVTPQPGVELPSSQTTPGPIPVAFRHVWAVDPADCTRDPSPSRIAIAPGAIRSSLGRAVVVKSEATAGDILILDVDLFSEGQTMRERHTLGLDRTETRLRYQRGTETVTYLRCD